MSETTTTDRAIVEELTGAAPELPALYRPPDRYRRIEGLPGTTFEGLWIEVKRNLTGAEMQVIQSQHYLSDLQEVMAPYIRAWNIEGTRVITEERPAITDPDDDSNVLFPARAVQRIAHDVLPPPATEGPHIFNAIDEVTMLWIRTQLLRAPYGGDDRGKGSTPSAPTQSGTPPAAKKAAKKNRTRRSSSNKP